MTTEEPTGLNREERIAIARLRALLELLPPALDRRLHDLGLTAFEYSLVEALGEAPDHRLRLSALASRTNATLPRLSRVVTGLERKGLLVKAQCAADARATNAVLTAAGEQAWRRAAPVYGRAVGDMVLGGLDAVDVDELARLSLAMLRRLDPDGRMAVTLGQGCGVGPVGSGGNGPVESFLSPSVPEAASECGADPGSPGSSPCAADPSSSTACGADPVPSDADPCGADPASPSSKGCGADPRPDGAATCAADPVPVHSDPA
jgi:Transcriptional regulators